MKKTFNFLLILLSVFVLISSCGKDVTETTTPVQVFSRAITSLPNLQDAVVVAVRTTDGAKMSFRADPSGVTVSIPNGTWRFYGYGWQNTPYNGQARCAVGGYATSPTAAEDIVLTGVATSINMVFTIANCGFPTGSNVFHNAMDFSGSTTFDNLQIFFCGEDVSTAISTCPTSEPAIGMRMQVRFSGFENLMGSAVPPMIFEPLSLKSACNVIASGANNTAFNLPPGNPNSVDFPFGIIVEMFPSTDTTCIGAPTKSIFLPDGLAKAELVQTAKTHLKSSAPNMNLFINYYAF
jgi:hypothetical protein